MFFFLIFKKKLLGFFFFEKMYLAIHPRNNGQPKLFKKMGCILNLMTLVKVILKQYDFFFYFLLKCSLGVSLVLPCPQAPHTS